MTHFGAFVDLLFTQKDKQINPIVYFYTVDICGNNSHTYYYCLSF